MTRKKAESTWIYGAHGCWGWKISIHHPEMWLGAYCWYLSPYSYPSSHNHGSVEKWALPIGSLPFEFRAIFHWTMIMGISESWCSRFPEYPLPLVAPQIRSPVQDGWMMAYVKRKQNKQQTTQGGNLWFLMTNIILISFTEMIVIMKNETFTPTGSTIGSPILLAFPVAVPTIMSEAFWLPARNGTRDPSKIQPQ